MASNIKMADLCAVALRSLVISLTMEAARTSKTTVSSTTQSNNPEVSHLTTLSAAYLEMRAQATSP
jgi:hypothetical protein